MYDEPIFIKKGNQISEIIRPGRQYKAKIKSEKMEVIIAELNPNTVSRWYQHGGEELHLVLEGEIEYTVGKTSYKMSEGDILWHKSTLRHRAKNNSDKAIKYITIGTPPSLQFSDL